MFALDAVPFLLHEPAAAQLFTQKSMYPFFPMLLDAFDRLDILMLVSSEITDVTPTIQTAAQMRHDSS